MKMKLEKCTENEMEKHLMKMKSEKFTENEMCKI